MQTKLIAGVVVGLLVGAGAGYMIPHGAAAKTPGQFGAGQFGKTGMGIRGGGIVAGQIIAKDATSITVKMQDGSTKLVLLSTSTPILKTSQASASDLSVGTDVVANGSSNSDGSVTANSVQIRPAGASNAPIIRYQGASQPQ